MQAIKTTFSTVTEYLDTTRWQDPWTSVKTKKAALYAISCIPLMGALGAKKIVASTLLPFACPSLAFAIPLVLTAGSIAYYSHSLIDYEKPEALDAVRREAVNVPLQEVIKKHGWKNLFKYQILDNPSFEYAYRKQAASSSFNELLGLYKTAKGNLDLVKDPLPYQIPHPSEWKEKFEAETKNLSSEQILKNYALFDLNHFGVLSSKKREILEKTQEALVTYATLNQNLGKDCKTRLEFVMNEIEKQEKEFHQARVLFSTILKHASSDNTALAFEALKGVELTQAALKDILTKYEEAKEQNRQKLDQLTAEYRAG